MDARKCPGCHTLSIVGMDEDWQRAGTAISQSGEDQLYVDFGQNGFTGEIQVYDLQGRKIAEKSFSGTRLVEMPVDGLGRGMYLLVMVVEGELKRMKFRKD